MRIVLAGNYDTGNIGHHATLLVLRRELERRFGQARITLLSSRPDRFVDEHYGTQSIRAQGPQFGPAVEGAISAADALVIGAGRLLVDNGQQLADLEQLTGIAGTLGTPVVLFAHTIVPPGTVETRQRLTSIAARAARISVREDSSREVLVRMGVSSEGIEVLPDPALALDRIMPLSVERCALLGLPADGRLLAVSPARLAGSRASRRSVSEGYERPLAQLLDDVIERSGARVVFVPQASGDGDDPESDDRVVARRVSAAMRNFRACTHIENRLDVLQLLALYGRVSAVLSAHRQAVVFAATQGVPGAVISTEPRQEYAARLLGTPVFEPVALAADDTAQEMHRMVAETELRRRKLLLRVGELAARIPGYAREFDGLRDLSPRRMETAETAASSV